MKNNIFLNVCLLFLLAGLSGCGLVESIFKTGLWTGVIIVVGIIALIIFAISKAGK